MQFYLTIIMKFLLKISENVNIQIKPEIFYKLCHMNKFSFVSDWQTLQK